MIGKSLAAGLIALSAVPADALCIYKGVDNAKTTLAQEFQDARWVVRAHVVSADYHWSDEDESWTRYRLKVVTSYKGKQPARFTLFTTRDSGGFYMDGRDGLPDLDGDYLLFLEDNDLRARYYPAAKGALWVNYSCGQSRPWREVTGSDEAQLLALAKRK